MTDRKNVFNKKKFQHNINGSEYYIIWTVHLQFISSILRPRPFIDTELNILSVIRPIKHKPTFQSFITHLQAYFFTHRQCETTITVGCKLKYNDNNWMIDFAPTNLIFLFVFIQIKRIRGDYWIPDHNEYW